MNNFLETDYSKVKVLSDGSKTATIIVSQLNLLIAAMVHNDEIYWRNLIKPNIENTIQWSIIAQDVPIFSPIYYQVLDYLKNLLYTTIWERKQLLNPEDFGLSLLFYQAKKVKICSTNYTTNITNTTNTCKNTCNQIHLILYHTIVDLTS